MIALKKHSTNSWFILKETGKAFVNDNALKLSASLSYYTVFSLVPMLVVIISLCSIFFGKDAIQGQVFWQIRQWTGNDVALQIQSMIQHAELSHKSWFASIAGFVTLFIGATGIFIEIQSSINDIWGIKAKPKRGLIRFFTNRALSFCLIISLGFLLLVSLVLNTIMDLLFVRIEQFFPNVIYLVYILNVAMVYAVICVLFAVIFKVLPDGSLKWRDAFVGAAFTALVFMLGKFIIGFYISKTAVIATYGPSSAVVLILIWVYFSSVILYFGAEFTKIHAREYGHDIIPNEYALRLEKKVSEVEEGKSKPKNLFLKTT